MNSFFIPLSNWLHVLATIIFIGYDLFMCLIFLPIFTRQMSAPDLRDLLERISSRLQPYFGGSILIFLVTGTYLLVINQYYGGLGHFFNNPWSALITIKHLLVVVFLALGIYADRAYLEKISDEKPAALKQFRRAINFNAVLGVVIILLTSIAQAF
jgi:uncharacterized membrane protein